MLWSKYIRCTWLLLRYKIESLVRRGNGVVDDDVPDDPESVRYWCKTGGINKEIEKEKQKGSMRINIKSSPAFGDALMSGPGGTLKKALSSASLAAPGTEEALALVGSLHDGASNVGALLYILYVCVHSVWHICACCGVSM